MIEITTSSSTSVKPRRRGPRGPASGGWAGVNKRMGLSPFRIRWRRLLTATPSCTEKLNLLVGQASSLSCFTLLNDRLEAYPTFHHRLEAYPTFHHRLEACPTD